jgi:membrane protease YdiL (CAAX protease family)
VASWFVTKWFCRSDNINLSDLGISLDTENRHEFLYGFVIGVGLWALLSFIQSLTAGFSWELRPNINYLNILYGLIFIFIADLGTELFTRGYPLTKFRESFGAMAAIIIMVLFVGLKSFSFGLDSELLFYSIIIPALHTVFFSIIYFKTKRLGAALGVHTGANFVTICIFDLRLEQPGQVIPSGVFQPNIDLESTTASALHLLWVLMAIAFSIVVYYWWIKKELR